MNFRDFANLFGVRESLSPAKDYTNKVTSISLQVKDLLGDGVNVNTHDTNGQTPLIISSEKGFLDIVEELVVCGADPNESDGDGWTALIAASKEGTFN